MATEGLTYTQYLYSLKSPQSVQYMIDLENAVNSGQISQYQFAETVESITGKKVQPYRAYNGDILGYSLVDTPTVNSGGAVNSNASTVARGTVARPITTTVNSGGNTVIQGLRGVGTKVATGAALVGTAAMCVSAGITLGKTIDSVLYNANPDFWDSNGMSSLNPETWRAITAGDDSLGASLLNVLFGFDDNGNGQAYMDETALAYMAAYMNQQGIFTPPQEQSTVTEDVRAIIDPNGYVTLPVNSTEETSNLYYEQYNISGSTIYKQFSRSISFSKPVKIGAIYNTSHSEARIMLFCNQSCRATEVTTNYNVSGQETGTSTTSYNLSASYSYSGNTVYVIWPWASHLDIMPLISNPPVPEIYFDRSIGYQNSLLDKAPGYIMWYGTHTSTGIQGIGTQTGAITPNVSTWSDIPSTLSSLQSQYPDLWNNAIQYPVVQPDGTVKTYTYVPVAMPDLTNRTDTQPTSGTATQTDPEISPSTMSQELIDALTKILTNPWPKTEPELDNPNPPSNPTDTGDGSSPIPVVPVGSASALWKVYHPTQAQIDSFGGWLWSSAFVDQILKIFNDPMQAIIGLHKIYATPVDAGTATIKVGYLDSQVPSAYVEQQYIEVDCGTVDLYEQFGNVFDYEPFTDVQLYLPFIGIVPLNVADVMRSTISITYGVDVLTGACLAMVEVSRDMNNAVMYQYAGNCAVQYPISSGSYMGIVASIISIAGGIAATAATGGGAAPIVLGAAGAAMNAHTNVQHSGSFSGNAGAMGGKIPYLIISRPQTKVAMNFDSMDGYPTNEYVTVGECSGYIKAESAHVINVNATDDELNMISEALYTGIII